MRMALETIGEKKLLCEDGIVVAECDGPEYPSDIDGLSLVKEKRYGRSFVLIYELA